MKTMNPVAGGFPQRRAVFWSRIRCAGAAGALLVLAVGAQSPPGADHASAFSQNNVLVREATRLQHTTVSPSLDAALGDSRNVLWCGTFQLAWNEACALVGEDIHFGAPNPAADALNKKTFTKESLDDASYVALAGFTRDGIYGAIGAELSKKFGAAATPRFVPPKAFAPRPQDIVAYAYLFKNLQFDTPFESLSRMEFDRKKVACFGFEGGKRGVEPLCSQVLIHDYNSSNNFVIELKTKALQDRVILAKVPPGDTLAATVARVRSRTTGSEPMRAARDDTLKLPKLNFDITRRYSEVENHPLVLRRSPSPQDSMLTHAVQNIRFQMDEKGVVLRSESHMVFACSTPHVPRPLHIMVFDQPFLVLLERQKASAPYFALWVDNPELLVR
jgi:hypothetical protein